MKSSYKTSPKQREKKEKKIKYSSHLLYFYVIFVEIKFSFFVSFVFIPLAENVFSFYTLTEHNNNKNYDWCVRPHMYRTLLRESLLFELVVKRKDFSFFQFVSIILWYFTHIFCVCCTQKFSFSVLSSCMFYFIGCRFFRYLTRVFWLFVPSSSNIFQQSFFVVPLSKTNEKDALLFAHPSLPFYFHLYLYNVLSFLFSHFIFPATEKKISRHFIYLSLFLLFCFIFINFQYKIIIFFFFFFVASLISMYSYSGCVLSQ